jgi:hypothetical protein
MAQPTLRSQRSDRSHMSAICLFMAMVTLLHLQSVTWAQQLPLPPRSVTAPAGRAFAASVSALSRADREEQIFAQIQSGNVPHFLRNLVPVDITLSIAGSLHTATCYVLPDYLAIGSDDDYFLMPMTPLLGQRIADAIGCVLPTRKLVDAIYQAAVVKLVPQPIAPSAAMITIPVFAQHNDSVWQQRSPLLPQWPLGSLVGGNKKDVIISRKIYESLKPTVPKPVVIYGWHRMDGTPIQPVYNGHEETYADYSHGIRLVRDTMVLDGHTTTVRNVLKDSILNVLLSDEGVILRPGYGITTDVEEGRNDGDAGEVGPSWGMKVNYPNPFNSTTTIPFTLSHRESVSISLFDLLGRSVSTILHETYDAGSHVVQFEARGLASGMYLVRFTTPSRSQTRALCLLQ